MLYKSYQLERGRRMGKAGATFAPSSDIFFLSSLPSSLFSLVSLLPLYSLVALFSLFSLLLLFSLISLFPRVPLFFFFLFHFFFCFCVSVIPFPFFVFLLSCCFGAVFLSDSISNFQFSVLKNLKSQFRILDSQSSILNYIYMLICFHYCL